MIKQIFNDKEIRFMEKDGEYWAVAGDVAKALGYRDAPSMTRNIDKEDITTHIMRSNKKGNPNITIISEYGIYEAIWNSRRDEADEFKKWVKQVIKELRHATGLKGYEAFRMLDKQKQKEAMAIIQKAHKSDKPINFIKPNTIANKAVSTAFGYKKMIGKSGMTPAMLEVRQVILDDVVKLTEAKQRFNLDIKVSKSIYDKYGVKS
ncbi:MAG: phage repressor protein [Staphylococcus equorum]|uniref:BRO-N domain-containing protein n=1 Tax=Staphylococcus TaxID=1279 RepID=UPI0025575000|nr:BRO family protein [Staphylococcus equorum]MDN5811329.1 phage repressor protein [Tetragenococcus koreensis]MDK9871994.1 BRO family protein [Staphylococcus equorum]MDK9876898.1 BRO family protein [Staphylococcus equorum]MDN6569759.1 phage repressor protein [Staphylococcus equorum]MDN6610637.1 phage repressor protein [Staphylococcus equorum]